MRAATIRDGEVLVEEDPDPGAGGGRGGPYPPPPGSPADMPGLELAGVVEALGSGASRFAVGDRVMGIVGGGGQGELAVVHERQLMAVPAAVSFPDAGGLPEVFTTGADAGLAP